MLKFYHIKVKYDFVLKVLDLLFNADFVLGEWQLQADGVTAKTEDF